MSYMSEMAIHEMEMEQYRDDNGMWECEFNEWVAAMEAEQLTKENSNGKICD